MTTLAEVLESTVHGMGYELVDTQVSQRGRLVRIFLDKPGGVSVDDCAGVSRQLQRVLAVEGIDYDRLEVSSPGLDRPLRGERDFARFAGQRADVRMRQPDETGRRRYVGRVRGVAQGVVTLEVDGEAVALQLDAMERARLVPEV
ncbi:MAG: ribosome maturation factor RimP [Betaproteobacteria bacterium RIFCSPLOWO2_02_67_12]|nr:MAG: ribosome maturation factor RimP [Betaproteobacteria bacterium RIFCSPLOWO2_02_67_12]OGA27956.1 MAG: ribosome maturation factor RimP [Betaproteobacteria bacterium RIFCSPLOWO2_02_FULL_68_150]OGA65810.1 MAG: ribosome maturation factor RimP [Betaproteobacteria bacterium RIFCSPLOWO2_12_FULL_67_28]